MRAAVIPALPQLSAAGRSKFWLVSPPLLLLLALAGLVAAVPPFGEFPVEDDWLYARAVEALIQHGQLQVPAWTATSLVLQACWGALIALLFGFSHSALRASTLLLSALGGLGCYLLLRELLDPKRAMFGSLLLLFNPLFVFLSYSFMTDVPFLALALWSMLCSVRAMQSTSPRLGWLAAGSALAGAAYL